MLFPLEIEWEMKKNICEMENRDYVGNIHWKMEIIMNLDVFPFSKSKSRKELT